MSALETLQARAKSLKLHLTTIYYAYRNERLKLLPKIIIGIAILYALSPLDLIPDFIPILGYLDDLLIVPALIALAIKMIPKDIMAEAEEKAKKEPIYLKKNWTFAVIFAVIWIAIAYVVVSAIVRAFKGI